MQYNEISFKTPGISWVSGFASGPPYEFSSFCTGDKSNSVRLSLNTLMVFEGITVAAPAGCKFTYKGDYPNFIEYSSLQLPNQWGDSPYSFDFFIEASAPPGVSGNIVITSSVTTPIIIPIIGRITNPSNKFNVTGGGIYCAGGTGVDIGLDGSDNGYLYTLYKNGANIGSLWGTGSAISFGKNTEIGTYTVKCTYPCSFDLNGSAVISIRQKPVLNSSSGPLVVPLGSTIQLSNSTPGGVWSSSDTNALTVNSSTGIVSAIYPYSFNPLNIYYTVTDDIGCSSTVANPIDVLLKWVGTVDSDWSNVANWTGGYKAGYGSWVLISNGVNQPVISYDFITCGQVHIEPEAILTIRPGKSLRANYLNNNSEGGIVLESDASGTGSLIVETIVGTGTAIAQSYITGNKWHIVSPTAQGGSISTFIQAAGNAIPSKSGSYGMMDYNETTNSWNSYYTASTVENLASGKGYSVRRTADGIVTFTGALTSGTKTVQLTKYGEGWNCVGNPYPSAIGINANAYSAENLITKNFGILDASYACVYVWDEDATYSGQNCYKILSNTGFSLPSGKTRLSDKYVAPGQGFFVKTAANNNILQFTAAMQSHQQTTALKSANVSWPGIQLTASIAQANASTVITFNNGMTNGLDVTYDSGLLRGTSGLELYSRLVDDNGVDFAIQCLPETYNSLVIPVGLESKAGGEITFSAETVELPTACSVILEDKLAKTFTSLANGATYKATVSAGKTAVGRFYIHTNNSTTGTSELSSGAFSLKAYPANGHIWIIGEVASGAKASLFDVNGRNLGTFNLQEGSRNSISSTGLAPGVYLLNVTQTEKRFNTKIVIY